MKDDRGRYHFRKMNRGKVVLYPSFAHFLVFLAVAIILYELIKVLPILVGRILETGNRFLQVALVLLAVAVITLVCIIGWNHVLRRKVKAKTEALRQNENNLRSIFETAAIGIATTDEQGNFLTVNPALLASHGFTAEEFAHFTVRDVCHPDDMQTVQCLFRELWNGDIEKSTIQIRSRHKEGHYIWGALTLSLVRNNHGDPQFSICMFEDITERKITENIDRTILKIAQAAASTGTLRQLFTVIHAILGEVMQVENFDISMFDAEKGKLRSAFHRSQSGSSNKNQPPILALSELVLKRKSPLHLAGEELKRLDQEDHVKITGRKPADWLGVPLSIGGQTIGVMSAWSYSNEQRLTQHDENLLVFVSTQAAQTIERKRAEEALIRSDEDMCALFAAMSDMVFVLDRTGRYLKISGSNTDILFKPASELIGRTLHEIMTTEKADIFLRKITNVLKTRKVTTFEYSLPIRNEEHWFLASLSPLDDRSVIWIAHDITDRKETEEALKINEARYHDLFEESPISLWEEDFSGVKQHLIELKENGIDDLEQYFMDDPQRIKACIAMIKIIDVNSAAMKLVRAKDKKQLIDHSYALMQTDRPFDFIQPFLHIANGLHEFSWEGWNRTIDGDLIAVNQKFSAIIGYEESLAKVIISKEDVSLRKKAETIQKYRSAYEELLLKTSSRFTNLPNGDLEREIKSALKSVGILEKVDRVSVLMIDPGQGMISSAYEWCKAGVDSAVELFQSSTMALLPWNDVQAPDQPVIIDDLSHPTLNNLRYDNIAGELAAKSLVIFPMWIDQKFVGVTTFATVNSNRKWEHENVVMMQQFTNILSSGIERTHLINKLNERAIHDELTGVLNRRGFLELARNELVRAARYNHTVSMILFDVDELKRINDSIGHTAGDRVIAEVAKCTRVHIRQIDTIGRWGGDEFVVLLPETDQDAAVMVASRLCQEVKSHSIDLDGLLTSASISAGVSVTTPDDYSIDSLFSRADLALYTAKQSGRNRVKCASEGPAKQNSI